MYYSAIQGLDLATKLVPGATTNTFNTVPTLDIFSQNLQNLLPTNFISSGSLGQQQLQNLTNLSNSINVQLNSLTPTIQNTVYNALNAKKGVSPINVSGYESNATLDVSSTTLLQDSQAFSVENAAQINQIDSVNNNTVNTGSLNQSITEEINKFNALTPKGIRDLRDNTIFNTKVATTTTTIKNNLYTKSVGMASTQASDPIFSDTAQNSLQQISSAEYSGDNRNGFDLYVRRTVYWAQGPGTDIDSANLRSSTGRQLQQGVSVAVDPSIIPYLSRIEFPDIGTRYATDTGGAVKAKTASKGTAPIVDIFFLRKEDAIAFANSNSPYITIRVYPPTTKYKYVANSSPTYGVA